MTFRLESYFYQYAVPHGNMPFVLLGSLFFSNESREGLLPLLELYRCIHESEAFSFAGK